MNFKIKSKEEYQKQAMAASNNPQLFWGELAQEFQWSKKWNQVLSGGFESADVKWFEGAKLNITENCLDRHLAHRGDQIALIFEPNQVNEEVKKYTYKQLHQEVCKASNMLQELGIKAGDRVCLYMSMVPELLISVLACARVGAIHSVVFGGFSAQSLAGRIQDAQCSLLITNDGGFRGDKIIPLKEIADEALAQCPSIKKVIVHTRANTKPKMMADRDYFWDDLMVHQGSEFSAVQMAAEDPLFILYTSGSTGKPKGVLHTCAGYMVWAAYTFQNVFQVEEGDIYWCTADIGWITGHTYITYGPLLSGATTMMFEGIPTYPDPGRFWQVVDKHQVTHFYTAPTAIRALMGCDKKYVENSQLSSLKVLGSVGEPINEEAWHWYYTNVGKEKCPIVDTWWQTETGGIMISSLAGLTEMKPCFATLPLPGVEPILVDEAGALLEGNNVSGHLCINKPWPGMARTLYGDHERFKQTYLSTYKGKYFTGDGCRRDENGFYRITGRVDDVINVSGHRLGTAEVENAINENSHVIESAVIGYPHDIKGQGIYAFVILETGLNLNEAELRKSIVDTIIKIIGPIAKPDQIQFVQGLPKTRSGKIMRRILRKLAEGQTDQLGDTSTLLDPTIVEQIKMGLLN